MLKHAEILFALLFYIFDLLDYGLWTNSILLSGEKNKTNYKQGLQFFEQSRPANYEKLCWEQMLKKNYLRAHLFFVDISQLSRFYCTMYRDFRWD